jgi:hypothetical protein
MPEEFGKVGLEPVEPVIYLFLNWYVSKLICFKIDFELFWA